jgi:hypothetical protein
MIVGARTASFASLVGGIGAVLVPKCPICLVAYASALTALGLGPGAHFPFVELLLGVLVLASFGLVVSLAVRRRDAVAALISGLGAALVFIGRLAFDAPVMTAIGAILLVTAAVANSALCRLGRLLRRRATT